MAYRDDAIDGLREVANAIKELAKTQCRHMWEPPKTIMVNGNYYDVQVCKNCEKVRKL